jgi:MYXO-CTERM domain-containing protein
VAGVRLFVSSALAALSLLLVATRSEATVTQPNGQIMPVDSANGEIQLYTLFSNLGEAIDYQLDAGTNPAVFSPLCDFEATFLLHEAGSSLAVGWYNVDPNAMLPPSFLDIHVIVPAGAPVGTVITAANIKNDPAYAGGLIGFALLSAQIHYSEPKWNVVCTGCNPPGPWITAVTYSSKLTPNAFYLAFEDGPLGTGVNGFNNDGDYNDYVYLFTGLTCSGGGQPCDTGQPGVCGPGLTQCTTQGIQCGGLTGPTNETCDGLDNNCDGATDEGDICPAGFVCDKGTCVGECGGGEFVCPPELVCSGGYCVDPLCAGVTCPTGEVCVAGVCKTPCTDVVCPYGQECRVGVCVDPCSAVTCEANQVCDKGICLPNCACFPCASGYECDPGPGLCIPAGCLGVSCPAGTHCDGGNCLDNCAGAVCPAGQICQAGQCVDDPSASASSSASSGFTVGVGGSGTGTGTAAGGASGVGGAPPNGAGGNQNQGAEDSGACGCRVAGGPERSLAALGAAVALFGLAARRRRRR